MSSKINLHVTHDSTHKDAVLLRRIVAGDERAFRLFFNKYYPQVHGFVLSFLKNVDDSEDVAQSVFINIWLRRELLAGVDNLEAYLYRAARNTVMNFIVRKHGEEPPLPIGDNQDKSSGFTPHDLLEAHDMQLLADMVVSHMPPQRRQVLELSRKAGLSNDEIAQRLNIRKKTVENHLNTALKELRKVLKSLFLLIIWV